MVNYAGNTLLYKTSDGHLSCKDVVHALKASGIKDGDSLFIHSDITSFGKLANFDATCFLKALVASFEQVVGPQGTIIMPTFSYSFCKSEPFDIRQTKSTVGTLTEFFRHEKDVVRTAHPIFSAAIWGNKRNFYQKVGTDSFGSDSIFDKLYSTGAKLVFFGASFHSCTYIHYVEQMYGVPYRYMKKFHGTISDGEKEYEAQAEFFVRYLEGNVILDLSRLKQVLLATGVMTKVQLGAGHIMTVSAKDLYEVGQKLLEQDIYAFLKDTPNIKTYDGER